MFIRKYPAFNPYVFPDSCSDLSPRKPCRPAVRGEEGGNPIKIGWDLRSTSQNPYPIYDHNL